MTTWLDPDVAAAELAIRMADAQDARPQPVYDPVDNLTDEGWSDDDLRALLEDYYAETWAMRNVTGRRTTRPTP